MGIDFYERLAKITLQLKWCEEFVDLEYFDRPDLIDRKRKLGIEVTHPSNKNEMMLNAFYNNNLEGKKIKEIDSSKLEKFRKYGRDVMFDEQTGDIYACRAIKDDFDINIIFSSIDKKIEKLNSGLYEYSNNICLYLELASFSLETSDYTVASEILNYCVQKKLANELYFKEVFYDCLGVIYRINIDKKTIEKQDIELDKVIDAFNNE